MSQPYTAPSAPSPYTPPKPYSGAGLPTPVGQVASAAPRGNSAPGQTLRQMGSAPTPLNQQAERMDRGRGGSGGSYTVQSGDTMYSISRRYNVSVDQMMAANGGSSTVRIGESLRIPGGERQPEARIERASVDPRSVPEPAPAVATSAPPAGLPPIGGASDNGEREVAVAPQTGTAGAQAPAAPRQSAPPPQQDAAASGFRWPVRGRVISEFGKKPNGERNDGINLAVPEGTPVKAAEDGTVIYAGNELKSYGNLVLVRHENGWVSAYAHNSQLKVKRGDQIRRGQVVAMSGMSGGVTTPQVHFELRKDATPVDPLRHMSET